MDLSLMKALDVSEIPPLLQKAKTFGGEVVQATLNSTHSTFIKEMEIDLAGHMRLTLSDAGKIDHSKPISINLNYRDCSFRIEPGLWTMNENILITTLPKSAKALAPRDNQRYMLPLNSKICVALHRVEKRSCHADINAYLIDISQDGIGILLPRAIEDVVLKHDHFWIKEIGHELLPKPIFGRTVYVTPRKYLDQSVDLRIGIALTERLPEETFEELQKLCRIVLVG